MKSLNCEVCIIMQQFAHGNSFTKLSMTDACQVMCFHTANAFGIDITWLACEVPKLTLFLQSAMTHYWWHIIVPAEWLMYSCPSYDQSKSVCLCLRSNVLVSKWRNISFYWSKTVMNKLIPDISTLKLWITNMVVLWVEEIRWIY